MTFSFYATLFFKCLSFHKQDDEEDFNMTHCSNNPKCQCKNCFLCCYTAIRRYRMYCKSYPFLYQAYKVILTLSVAQVACEKTLSKRKYVKNRLSQLSDDHLDSLLLMRVERDILAQVSNDMIIDELVRSSAETRKLLCCTD